MVRFIIFVKNVGRKKKMERTEAICKVCNEPFLKLVRTRKISKLPRGVRGVRNVTCSPRCSKILRDSKV